MLSCFNWAGSSPGRRAAGGYACANLRRIARRCRSRWSNRYGCTSFRAWRLMQSQVPPPSCARTVCAARTPWRIRWRYGVTCNFELTHAVVLACLLGWCFEFICPNTESFCAACSLIAMQHRPRTLSTLSSSAFCRTLTSHPQALEVATSRDHTYIADQNFAGLVLGDLVCYCFTCIMCMLFSSLL